MHKNFLIQVQSVYSSLGIPTGLKLLAKAEGSNKAKWVLNLVGNFAIDKFKNLVQPYATKKISDTSISNNESGYPPEFVTDNDIDFRHKWCENSKQMTYGCAVECDTKVTNLIPVAVDEVVCSCEIEETYDIAVADRNEFVARGMLVHNSARMATKNWRDRDIIEFIDVKRGGFLWSANNSILVDSEFWQQASDPRPSHGRRVFEAASGAAYYDETGEPGFINVHKLSTNTDGIEDITEENYLNPDYDLILHPKTYEMISKILKVLKRSEQLFITNPCGEIVLAKYGGYCVIGDVVLSRSDSLEVSKQAVALTARALIRTNLMPALYQSEVNRTNRIGVGLTGIFEYAWIQFKLSFYDLISVYDHVFTEPSNGSATQAQITAMEFWEHIAELRVIVQDTATQYSEQLGVVTPHSFTTIKPSGTISKVLSCTEGAHLPPYLYYIRWVICEKDSTKHQNYKERGYPIKDVSHQYHNCVVVGFPTKHPITDIIDSDKLVTARDISAQDQFKWVALLERFWFGDDCMNNQVSYTLKYNQNTMSHDEYTSMILKWQPTIKCCAVMPFTKSSAYAYLPEEEIDETHYSKLIKNIDRVVCEDYDEAEIECSGGACPIEAKIR